MKQNLLKTLMALGLIGVAHSAFAVAEGEMFPPLEIARVDSKDKLATSGKFTILNFWATWCDACKVELKEMQKEFAKISERPDVVVGYVSLDKDSAKAKQWLVDSFGANSTMVSHLYTDPSFAAADKLGVDSFPMTIVVDKAGKIIKVQRGFKEGQGSTKALAALVIRGK